MFEAADIREWRGHDVVDADGHKIGKLEAVYVEPAQTSRRSARSRSECRPGTGSCSGPLTRRPWVRSTSGSVMTRASEGCPLDRHRRRAARGRRRGDLQARGLANQPGGGSERQLARR